MLSHVTSISCKCPIPLLQHVAVSSVQYIQLTCHRVFFLEPIYRSGKVHLWPFNVTCGNIHIQWSAVLEYYLVVAFSEDH